MGFLKRFLSIGSRRKKQKKTSTITRQVDNNLEHVQEEPDVTLSRLLRSSSARFAVISEADYTSLPPLPHPINNVVHTSEPYSTNLGDAAVARSGTYNVTLHGRTRCTLSKFPDSLDPAVSDKTTPSEDTDNQQPSCTSVSMRHRSKSMPVPVTPRDSNSLQVLRHDPSVVSLLNMYDEHGCLPAKAFSNTPPSPGRGRTQARRNGSTLRQLLGNPVSRTWGWSSDDGSALEGDISWAEHILGEEVANSSTSSFGTCLEVPTLSAIPFADDRLRRKLSCTTISKEYDYFNVFDDPSADNPAISSMEVEISMVADSPPSYNPTLPYRHEKPMTPQRASQVFSFLTERRKSYLRQEATKHNPLLPTPPSTIALESPFKSCSPGTFAEFDSPQTKERSMSIPDPHDTHIGGRARTPSLYSSRSCTQLFAQSHPVNSHSQHGSRRSTSISHDVNDNNSSCNKYHSTPLTRYNDVCANLDGDVRTPLQTRTMNRVTTIITISNPSTPINDLIQYDIENYPTAGSQCGRVLDPKASYSTTESLGNDEGNVKFGIEYREGRLAFDEKSHDLRTTNYIVSVEDPFTPIPARKRKSHLRMLARGSFYHKPTLHSCDAESRGEDLQARKENEPTDIGMVPVTPIRTYSRTPFNIPLPAMSSELSPIGQQLMTDLRQQRIRAREKERKGRRRR